MTTRSRPDSVEAAIDSTDRPDKKRSGTILSFSKPNVPGLFDAFDTIQKACTTASANLRFSEEIILESNIRFLNSGKQLKEREEELNEVTKAYQAWEAKVKRSDGLSEDQFQTLQKEKATLKGEKARLMVELKTIGDQFARDQKSLEWIYAKAKEEAIAAAQGVDTVMKEALKDL